MESNGVMTSARHKISRRRPANSCESCRRRKIKCDQGLPCGSCVRARSALLCSYRDNHAVRNGPGGGSSSSSSIGASGTASNKSQGESTSTGGHSSESNYSPSSLSNSVEQIGNEVRQSRLSPDISQYTQDPPDQGQQPLPIPPCLVEEPPAAPFRPEPTPSWHCPVAPPVPRLRQAPEKTKVFPQHHWAHVADRFPSRKKFDAVNDEPACAPYKTDLHNLLKDTCAVRQYVKYQSLQREPCPISNLPNTFPSQETCDALLFSYVRTMEPMYRILHVPCFLRDYRAMWAGDTRVATNGFHAKLALVLAIGSTFHSATSKEDLNSLRRLAQTWIQSVQTWVAGPAEKSICTIEGFQTLCLLFIARHTTYNCSGESAWFSAKSILSTAMTMGLHRNPAIFPQLTPAQREMRIRLWTTALELALQSSLDSSLPIGLTQNDYDVPLPSNVNDRDLHSEGNNMFRTSGGFTDSSVQKLLAKSQALRLRVVNVIASFHESHSYDSILDLGSQLRVANREVAAFFQDRDMSSAGDLPSTSLEATDFHRKFIDIALRRCTLVLHRPSMIQARKDPRLYLSRKICADSSMEILSHLQGVDMAAPASDLEDLARLSLVGRGSFKGPFSLDAIMALLFEVSVQLDRNSAQYSERDPFEESTKAERAPLIKTLEDTRQQLFQMIGRGSASFKRYFFVTGYLKQVYDTEGGLPRQSGLLAYITSEVRKCLDILNEMKDALVSEGQVDTFEDQMPIDIMSFNPGFSDQPLSWDLTDMMNFPGIDLNDNRIMSPTFGLR